MAWHELESQGPALRMSISIKGNFTFHNTDYDQLQQRAYFHHLHYISGSCRWRRYTQDPDCKFHKVHYFRSPPSPLHLFAYSSRKITQWQSLWLIWSLRWREQLRRSVLLWTLHWVSHLWEQIVFTKIYLGIHLLGNPRSQSQSQFDLDPGSRF